jgi:hypothetical protein
MSSRCGFVGLEPCCFALWAAAAEAIDKQTMDATIN